MEGPQPSEGREGVPPGGAHKDWRQPHVSSGQGLRQNSSEKALQATKLLKFSIQGLGSRAQAGAEEDAVVRVGHVSATGEGHSVSANWENTGSGGAHVWPDARLPPLGSSGHD